MKLSRLTVIAASLLLVAALTLSSSAEEMKTVQLPEPKLDPTKTLVQALKDRKTTREYAEKDLPEQTLSGLLWAAYGINRPDSGRRTVPSTKNWQEIELYVATSKAMFLYDAKANALIPKVSKDIRALTYSQAPFKDAPVHLVFVADLEKMGDAEESAKMVLAGMDTAFISQNVYLYCAAEELSTGFRVTLDKAKLAEAMKLKPTQKIVGAQSIGFPKRK